MKKEACLRKIFLSSFLIWQTLFLIFPLIILIYKGFFNLNFFEDFFWIIESRFVYIIFKTFLLSFVTAFLSLIIGYIVSYIISKKKPHFEGFFLLFMTIPFLTNFVIHAIAWSNLLQNGGFINCFLKKIFTTSNDFSLLYNNFAIIVGNLYCFLPLIVFPVYNSIQKFDKNFFEASFDLGASFLQTIFKIVLPMTKSGIYTGFFLVLVSSAGEFMIPEILGGDKFIYCGSAFSNVLLNSSLIEKGALMGIIFIIFLSLFCVFSYFFLEFLFKLMKKL